MKRMTFGLLTAATLVLGACADNPISMLIRHNNAPEPGCLIPGEISDTFIGQGFLDVTQVPGVGSTGYLFTPAVQSGLVEDQQTTGNIIILQGARVELVSRGDALGDAAIAALGDQTRRTVRTSGSIDPGGSTGMAFEIIDAVQVDVLRGLLGGVSGTAPSVQLVARVVVFGTVEGAEIESPAFDYPVTVCLGCLVTNLGDCNALSSAFVPSTGGVCSPVQDGRLDCCTLSGSLICPAQGLLQPMP